MVKGGKKVTISSFMLNYDLKTRLERRYYSLKCFRCGESLQFGEQVISKGTKHRRRRYYHKACWEKLFL